MTDYDSVDFFSDPALVPDPYPYFEHLRGRCPVVHLPQHGVVAVTGYDEASEVYRDADTYSNCNTVTGPFPGLPVAPDGDDASDLIDRYRHRMPLSEYVVTQDPPAHAAQRALVMRLLTPKRMKENEAFMWRLADHQIDAFVDRGSFEVVGDYAQPFAMLVIADLLGVPEEDRARFRDQLLAMHAGPTVRDRRRPTDGGNAGGKAADPLEFLTETFTGYVEDRRRRPRADVLTQLANATYPDGSEPEVDAIVRMAVFLFAAGQDTTTRLVSWAMRFLAEQPELQALLRREREVIPNFVDEVLRLESPVKSDFRMARRSTTLAGVDIAAGTTVMLLPGAANRDPRHFDDPTSLCPERPNAAAHLSFGRGIHSCPGGPLSRLEARVSLERLLDRLGDVRIDDANHGPPGDRRFDIEPIYILRGMERLHLTFTGSAGGEPAANHETSDDGGPDQ